MNFSVLISLYIKEKPESLAECLESLKNQTLQANEVVIVFDGKITSELEDVVSQYSKELPIKVIRLAENVGLGKALQKGVLACNHEIIARMDTDDIATPDRFEKQINFLKTNPQVSVLGSNISEFNLQPNDLKRKRVLPEKHSEIYEFAKFRCPINHPTVVFKKEDVLQSGNYSGKLLLWEDYTLWVTMLSKGYIFHNLQKNLLHFRVKDGRETIKRRSGLKYALNELKFAKYMRKIGFLSSLEYLKFITLRPLGRLLPTGILLFIYNKIYRRNNE
ncbi:glycosyltransferase [Capnocytophaga cynodegmi]|uniref:glycosyltransferase n=1 Tax=Capnocytophaga cynodegmi TaxID=28189 RepID=UPI001ACF798C|nr:glycosyltransferase [Capnocytophaga cynodegmi]GIM55023.1 glycosyl transferase [Capnocytophaga cynodegmi]